MMNDFTGIPSAICTRCSGEWIMTPTHFDTETYEIDAYGLQGAYCWSCGYPVTPPTPIEMEME
jgi:uncharacterized OB-fold protein